MFGSQMLEVAIGVIFVFVLVGVICSAIREGIEAWLKTRAAFLERGIRELLHDVKAEGIAKSFYNHPLIFSLYAEKYTPGKPNRRPGALTSGKHLPSYIPAKNFALALMDIAARGPEMDDKSSGSEAELMTMDSLRTNITKIQNPAVQRVLLTAIDSAQGDMNMVQAYIENWYNSGMDRVSGWYKRSTQWVIFWIALFATVMLNINTLTIADYLYRNDMARAIIVATAEKSVNEGTIADNDYIAAKKELVSLSLPIGWEKGWQAPLKGLEANIDTYRFWSHLIALVLGWLITAFAATLGAPFWFDVLNKVMVIRSTVKPHEKSPEESSEDRQFPKQQPQQQPIFMYGGMPAFTGDLRGSTRIKVQKRSGNKRPIS